MSSLCCCGHADDSNCGFCPTDRCCRCNSIRLPQGQRIESYAYKRASSSGSGSGHGQLNALNFGVKGNEDSHFVRPRENIPVQDLPNFASAQNEWRHNQPNYFSPTFFEAGPQSWYQQTSIEQRESQQQRERQERERQERERQERERQERERQERERRERERQERERQERERRERERRERERRERERQERERQQVLNFMFSGQQPRRQLNYGGHPSLQAPAYRQIGEPHQQQSQHFQQLQVVCFCGMVRHLHYACGRCGRW